jgi:hypothetical protein
MRFMSLCIAGSPKVLPNEPGNASAPSKPPDKWNSGAGIDASTGGLSVNLVHLVRFKQAPVLIDTSGNTRVYKFRGSRTSMYIVVSNYELDSSIKLKRDHLFLLVANNRGKQLSSGSVYLILRQLDAPRKFHLVCSCEQLYFGRRLRKLESGATLLKLSDLQRSSYFQLLEIKSLSSFEENWISSSSTLREVFIRKYELKAILPVFQGLLNEERHARPGFLETYFHCVKEFSAELVEDMSGVQWIQLKLPPTVWNLDPGIESFSSLWYSWKWEGKQWCRFSDRVPDSLASLTKGRISMPSNKCMYVRTRVELLKSQLQRSRLVTSLRSLNVSNRLRSEQEEEFSILQRLDTWEENNMASPELPWGFDDQQEAYGFDGSTYRVTIV